MSYIRNFLGALGPSLHKLPISLSSEEEKETKNEDIKIYPRGYTPKMTRLSTMEDVCIIFWYHLTDT